MITDVLIRVKREILFFFSFFYNYLRRQNIFCYPYGKQPLLSTTYFSLLFQHPAVLFLRT